MKAHTNKVGKIVPYMVRGVVQERMHFINVGFLSNACQKICCSIYQYTFNAIFA
jgi:hypothetical protein